MGYASSPPSNDNTARVWDVRYLSEQNDLKAATGLTRAELICQNELLQAKSQRENPETGELEWVYHDRLITAADVKAVPALQGREGADVCEPILKPPPWWHALAFW